MSTVFREYFESVKMIEFGRGNGSKMNEFVEKV